MTNQQKDLQNAREYLKNYFPHNAGTLFLEPKNEKQKIDAFIDFEQILSFYVQHLEQKGVIKFTENRYNEETR